ncbi:MAG: radical SAM protein [Vulcanimicrobiota bacterium]
MTAKSQRRKKRQPSRQRGGEPLLPLCAGPDGQVEDVPGLLGLARSGCSFRVPEEDELIPLPPGADLQLLPERRALALDPDGRQVELDGLAVAARIPVGYTRTLLPAFAEPPEGVGYLPFFGYTAVFARGEELLCAALQTESNPHWAPQYYHQPELGPRISELKERFPENRILDQLETCALEYGCYNAQNIFMHRWEGAVTVSPACNAQCRGCISLQPEDLPPSPQERFKFKPLVEEIVELGAHHLASPDAIFSFGQGCEGEPLLAGDAIAEAVERLAALPDRGSIHLNSNASLPEKLKKIVEAGLDSLRVSTNSVLPRVYEAYYQPRRYNFEAVRESTRLAGEAGCHLSLNLLMMPGWTDAAEEVEGLVKFVNDYGIDMIQLRTLNIDPNFYAAHVPLPEGPVIGIPQLLSRLTRECPKLTLGNHSPRVFRRQATGEASSGNEQSRP